MDASGVDFSDRLRRSTNKKGYACWSGDYEICGPGEEETPLQKYQRLNCEVRELMESLDDARKAEEKARTSGGDSGEKSKGGGSSLSSVAAKVSGLQDELAAIRLEETLGPDALKRLQDPQVRLANRLQKQVSK